MLVSVPGARVNVEVSGDGPPVLLLHGWPHTSFVWHEVAAGLADQFTVLAPDMRGIGASEPTDGGRDAATLAGDVIGVLDALGLPHAGVVAIDAGVAPAFLAALTHPERVSRLVLMEGLLPGVSGAEEFLGNGPPWWFGFHSVPELAETVLEGREAEYLAYFLTGPSIRRDIGADARDAFTQAYTGRAALRAGFELYRAGSANAQAVSAALRTSRLTMPTLAVSGGVVGAAIGAQLTTVADDLHQASVDDCGHIIPLEQPAALVDILRRFML
ncbi:alpha/beta fold hydrolase [Aeromicrobium endophyticum]|uniref:Alpha/beta hydrolase n=1 Tax=Aeromicrobium endophyticum TaxID=2292704 RepID=A0A371PB24_9ACTN|nr:alpha/beta hydrolase [Aeromicrobium endophyticum]REK72756.1 alpha/beta hydrolase [Aeromicrobium endophyticum]